MTTWAPAVVAPALLPPPPPPPHHHHHRWRRHPSSAPLFPAATRMCSNRTTAATCNPIFPYPSGGPPRRRRRTRTSSSSSSCLLLRQESAPPLRRFSPLLLPPPRKNDPLELPPWRSPGRSSGISRVWEEAGGDAEVAVVEDDEEAGTAVLEAEIYDFMLGSPNPGDFPTKEQLIAAGRTDLVEAIASHGGWLAFGWDLDEEEEEEGAEQVQRRDFGLEQGRKAGGEASTSQSEHGNAAGWVDDAIFGHQRFSATTEPASSSAASVSGRPIEMEGGEESGIEGILSRLEKGRNLSYVVGAKDKEVNCRISSKNNDYSLGAAAGGIERGSRSISLDSRKDFSPDFVGGMHSEAAEVVINRNRKGVDNNFLSGISMDDNVHTSVQSANEMTNGTNGPQSDVVENDRNQINSCLQLLESELTSVLSSLRSRIDGILSSSPRSRTDGISSHEGQQNSLKELHKLSDVLEFQETEIMNARDKLRSTRAKLAVLEGKMALEIIEAQKVVEEKQKRIDATQKALRLLCTAYVVWPNPASEVLLAGSFDGWTSQRTMERSSTGIFSLYLKLYPGQHEIKFIVDGVWKVDPLRPIVHNNGYENNLLIIS